MKGNTVMFQQFFITYVRSMVLSTVHFSKRKEGLNMALE